MILSTDNAINIGFSTPINEASRYSLNITEFVIEKPSVSVMVSVHGDSMALAGIFSGDKLIVEKTSHAKNGDIVVAKIDSSYTLKFFEIDPSGRALLRSADKEIGKIYPEESLEIFGVIRSLIRKF